MRRVYDGDGCEFAAACITIRSIVSSTAISKLAMNAGSDCCISPRHTCDVTWLLKHLFGPKYIDTSRGRMRRPFCWHFSHGNIAPW
jgi:hypothetical protein